MRTTSCQKEPNAHGFSLIELMIMLVVLTVGILAVAQIIPTSTREHMKDRHRTVGNYYAQDKTELLKSLGSSSPDLAEGRHPGVVNNESVGPSGTMARYWIVSPLAEPLDNLTRLDVVVRWQSGGRMDSVIATFAALPPGRLASVSSR